MYLNLQAYLCVVQSLPQSLGVHAHVHMATLIHQLQVGGTMDPRCIAGER